VADRASRQARIDRINRQAKIDSLEFLAAGVDATAVGSDEQPESGPLFPHVPGEHFKNRLRFFGNIPQNLPQFISNAAAASLSPLETIDGLVKAAQQLPFEVFKRGFEKFSGETLPEFPGRIPEGQQDFGKLIFDDFNERYGSLEAIDKTSTERPAEFAADLSIFAKPVAAASRMPAVSNIASRINPLDLSRRGLSALGHKGRQTAAGVADVGEKAIVGSAEVLTGTQEAPARAFQVGTEASARPGQSAAFDRARRGVTEVDDVHRVAVESLREVFEDAKARFNLESDRLFREKRKAPSQSPFVLARALDGVKASIVENLRRFRVDVKGRGGRLSGALEGAEQVRQPSTKTIRRQRDVAEIRGGEEATSFSTSPLTAGEEAFVAAGIPSPWIGKGTVTDITKQKRPGSARSKNMEGVLDPDFDNSTIGSQGQRATIKSVMNEVLKQETATTKDLNSLLQRIDSIVDEASIADPGLRSNAFVVALRKELRDVLSTVDGYDDVAKIYEEAREFNHDFAKTFSLDSPTVEGALNKFEDALGKKASKKHRVRLLEKLALKNARAENLAAEIAGVNLSELFGRGLIGRSVGTALLTGAPAAAAGLALGGLGAPALGIMFGGLVSFAVSSPRVMGKLLRTAGAKKTQVQGLVKAAEALIKAADTKGIATQGLTWGQLIERVSGEVTDTPIPAGHGIAEGSLPDFSGLQRQR
jgi:hypothetical protein